MNFVPTRPIAEITQEYIDAFWQIYEPMPYLKRTFRHFMMMNGWRGQTDRPITAAEMRLLWAVCWRQGVIRSTRFRFWWQLLAIAILKTRLLYDYVLALGAGEHFFSYRHLVKAQLEEQLAAVDLENQTKTAVSVQKTTSAYATPS